MIGVVALSAGPVSAQVDLTGTWQRVAQNDNGFSREPVDLLGMPLSADGRAKALSYDIAALSATERQCQMYPPYYALVGPFPLQFVMVPDPVTQKLLAWKILGWGDRDETVIWMDGRPHPSKYAPHSHGGFTTGTWEGDTLTAVTTHAKLGDIKRHRGFSSDRATLTYRFNRHGDLLTVTGILEDPVYLAEPFVLSEVFRLTTNMNNFPLTACEPIEELPHLHENPEIAPHYLPGKNPSMNEVTERYNIPLEAVLGGPETMYPEYRKKLKDKYVMPPPCKEGCGGGARLPRLRRLPRPRAVVAPHRHSKLHRNRKRNPSDAFGTAVARSRRSRAISPGGPLRYAQPPARNSQGDRVSKARIVSPVAGRCRERAGGSDFT